MYSPIHPVVGIQAFNEVMVPDTTQRWTPGMIMDAVDPYFGYGRFVYLQSSGAVAPGRLQMVNDQTLITADLPNTANTGFPIVVARQNFSAINQWGWWQLEGVCPLQAQASVAAGAQIGIGAAGQVGAVSAGKMIMNARVLQPSTFTLTKSNGVIVQNADNRLFLSNTAGLFYGLAVTGSITGIGGGSTVNGIDPSGRFITLSANTVAVVTIPTVTFTYTGFVLAYLQNAFVEGQIT